MLLDIRLTPYDRGRGSRGSRLLCGLVSLCDAGATRLGESIFPPHMLCVFFSWLRHPNLPTCSCHAFDTWPEVRRRSKTRICALIPTETYNRCCRAGVHRTASHQDSPSYISKSSRKCSFLPKASGKERHSSPSWCFGPIH